MTWKSYLTTRYTSSKRFIAFVVQHFFEDDCPYRASALAFTSILAIVPLMTVGLSILSSFPVFQGLINPLQNFVFENFIPATGKMIQSYLQQFTAQVSKLPIWGVVFLIIVALLMMVTIEKAMNRIWRVECSRGISALLLYWSILSLAPVFLGLSLAASSYLFSLPFLNLSFDPTLPWRLLPYMLSLVGFTFLYVVVPNRPIKIRYGFIGALVATILFESAKKGFAYYLTRFNAYQLLYGAFAAIPLFFIWIYWVWIITLLGAEISYALAVHHQRRTGIALPPFIHALLWLEGLWLRQKMGAGATLDQLTEMSSRPYAIDVGNMINILEKAQLIHADAHEMYHLSRDLDKLSLYSIYQLLPFQLPHPKEFIPNSGSEPRWLSIFAEVDSELERILAPTLAEVFSEPPCATKK